MRTKQTKLPKITADVSERMAAVEAVLFANGEPVPLTRLAASLLCGADEAREAVAQLERRYDISGGGICLLRLGNSFQLATRPEHADEVRRALETRKQQPLSQAAIEVLSLIAYNQPVTKAFIETVRGVDSGSVVNTLAERGLVEEAGRLDLPGRPVAFRTTETFLRCFGLESIADLPPLPGTPQQKTFDEIEEDYTDDVINEELYTESIKDEEVVENRDEDFYTNAATNEEVAEDNYTESVISEDISEQEYIE
ncbi:MAG: SMC-Scp complex subunit ScpB [Oscillospiraceae bacterium]|jgi:segregation and condensation protein B|nr:SMC-Scp complex subunit ScpB [Oscillospiraceae bacterium]